MGPLLILSVIHIVTTMKVRDFNSSREHRLLNTTFKITFTLNQLLPMVTHPRGFEVLMADVQSNRM